MYDDGVSPLFVPDCRMMVSLSFVPDCRMMVSPSFVPDCRMMVRPSFVPDCRMMVSPLFVPGCRMMVSPSFVPGCRMMVSPSFVPDCRMMVSPLFVPDCRMMVSPSFVPDCRMLVSPLFIAVVVAVSDLCAGSSPTNHLYTAHTDESSPGSASAPYAPNWRSLDTRPLPQWYDDVKFGIFIVWGVYAVPAYKTEWFWERWQSGSPSFVQFMKENYPPDFTYADFAAQFTAEFFDPDQWMDMIEASGARWAML